MAAIVNDRDVLLQAAPVRILPVSLPDNISIDVDNVLGAGALAKLDFVDAETQVTNLGDLAYADTILANQIGAGELPVGVIYAGDIKADQIDSRGLSIYTPSGQLVLDASRTLQVSDLADAGVLAAMDSLTLGDPELQGFGTLAGKNSVSASEVTGLGALATQNAVDLSSQVVGALSAGSVSGLGALALLNTVNLSTQTTGALNGQTQVTNLGSLAYANSIAANQIGAGTLAAGVVYAGEINAEQINGGSFSGETFTGGTFSGAKLLGSSEVSVTNGGNFTLQGTPTWGGIEYKAVYNGATGVFDMSLVLNQYGPTNLNTLSTTGNAALGGTLSVQERITAYGGIRTHASSEFNGSVSISGGNLGVNGLATISQKATFNGGIDVNGNIGGNHNLPKRDGSTWYYAWIKEAGQPDRSIQIRFDAPVP